MKTPFHTQDLIVVVGMHRSGTSAITRGLATLGCTLGDNLIEAVPGINDKGFWEDVDVNSFNQQLLEDSYSDWFHCTVLPEDYFHAPLLRDSRQAARELLAGKLRQGRPLAIKEPRMTILLPFWQEVFSDLGLNVAYLHVLRNPFEVTQSLLVRDGFSQERSMLLWFLYNQAALRYTHNTTHVVVDYGVFLENPAHQLTRIAGALGLSDFDPEHPDSRYYLHEFLDDRLRHAQSSHSWRQEEGSLPEPWKRLYGYLEACSRGEQPPTILSELDRYLDDLRLHQKLIEELELDLASQRKRIGQMVEAQKALEAEQIERYRHQQETVGQQNALLSEQQQALESLEKERDQLQETVGQQNALLSEQQQALESLEKERDQLQETVGQQNALLSEQQQALESLEKERDQLQRAIELIFNSKSWRITLPMRWGRMVSTMVLRQSLRMPSILARGVQRRLSLATQSRVHIPSSTPLSNGKTAEYAPPTPVRCRDQVLPLPSPVRMIAFHLPQYHEIPENNQWWGIGFTEWSNVQPAEPLFPGHYQPHVPLNGYYDLTDPTVLPRQAEQARRYGIEGFCFYFYWFHGHRLLEKPLQMLMEHPEWEISYCLCWANENWTRRWDGLEQDVLIAQDYSAEDDYAFIAHLEQYLRDPRYIRIEGKPLLLLYRPDLLPNATASVSRWREHCRTSGIGEIYVAYTQSFENRDPRDYGMDAAVEFPPNNSAPPECSAVELGCGPEFDGRVYDWSIFPQRAAHYTKPPYTLFRGLNPGWDNTPRRKQRATIFINNNPVSYHSWAKAACEDTIERITSPQERVVFINAWNEWGEGAHLEPDIRLGCAYLEATHMAQIRSSIHKDILPNKSSRIAVVIHAFYPDILHDICSYLQNLPPEEMDLWITTPEEKRAEVVAMLASLGHRTTVVTSPNRGRDVLPFLSILPHILTNDYGYVLKVHTKKSLHRADGASWRDVFYKKLLNQENLDTLRERMTQDRALGMVAPQEHIVPLSLFWGSNARQLLPLAQRMGITPEALTHQYFVAGTMFFCRWQALLPVLALNLRSEDFDDECGQVDGTMAHAVERVFAMACYAADLKIDGF